MTPEQAAEIFRLREAKVAPKQIACKLGLRPAEVNTFIARNLGFKPGSDLNTKAQAHLGLRPETPILIEFGRDGQPFYISGPYDNPEKIIKTLEASVGEGNFHYVAGIRGLGDDFLGEEELFLP